MNPGVDLNLLWAAAAGLVVGAGLVFLLMRRGGSVNRERAESLTVELDETRLELECHREEVATHFAETSDLFHGLTEQYSRLYAHLATGAREFCSDEVPALGQGLDAPLLVVESPPPAAVATAEAEAPAKEQAADDADRLAVEAPVPAASGSNGGSALTH